MIDSLEERFKKPSGWSSGEFFNPDTKHTLYYTSVKAANPKAVVVVLGGLSEFSEKYFEFARDMLARDFSFFTMDWAYQGRSSRLPKEKFHRRHSDGFDKDVNDLHKFITEQVQPAAISSNHEKLPLILVAHSMGGLIGLRYISEHRHIFNAAAFSAPLLGLPGFGWKEKILLTVLYSIKAFRENYIPNGTDWNDKRRAGNGLEIFSSDPARDTIHPVWSLAEKTLQVGDPTVGWVYEAIKSFKTVNEPGYLERIDIPVLLTIAGQDAIVSKPAIQAAKARISDATLLTIDGAKHEILMEQDIYRNQFMSAFDKLLEENKILPSAQPY